MKRRFIIAITLTVLFSQVSLGDLAAKDPPAVTVGGGDPPSDDRVLPLSAEQRASRDRKEAMIAQVAQASAAGEVGTMSCPVPNGETNAVEGMDSELSSCGATPRKWTLPASPRQQANYYYCGPAVVQVVSNYSWAYASSNKYSQSTISQRWTKTDATKQTYLGDFIYGMNGASRLPYGFVYAQKHQPSFSTWHTTIVSGIYNWRMPLAAGVRPHEHGAYYYIVSWPVPKSAGHYIGIFGYDGFASTSNLSRKVYYTDTAGPYAAAGVKAGNFWDISYDVYKTMMMNNGNMVY